MSKNMGNIDRMARFAIGALLIVLAFTGTIGAWGYIGVVPLATAFIKFCPLYTLLGFKTCKDC
ncbi:MAG: YgaP family membrane protein [Planktomarina sp.]